jgi:hypothetical protein
MAAKLKIEKRGDAVKVNLVRRLKDCLFYDTLNIGNSK